MPNLGNQPLLQFACEQRGAPSLSLALIQWQGSTMHCGCVLNGARPDRYKPRAVFNWPSS